MTLDSPITDIKGVGAELAKKFAILKITTVNDLLLHYPRRYEDFSVISPISQIRPGPVTIQASVKQSGNRYARRGMTITEAVASDESGSVRLLWFNQPYRAASIQAGQQYFISGDFGLRRQRLSVLNPSMELVSDFPVNTARVMPVYRETKGLKSNQIRRIIATIRPLIRDSDQAWPEQVMRTKTMSHEEAIETMHFPGSIEDLGKARERLGFEEVFSLSLAALLNKQQNASSTALSVQFDQDLARSFVSKLPFQLTADQKQAVWQAYQDMAAKQPMNRLLEGDVGAGKTVVATMISLMVLNAGYQVAFMAPTELLARQHFKSISESLKPFKVRVGLLIGSLTPKEKADMQKRIAGGEVQLLIGTHALISEKVDMHKLGLVIVDEQHRFGVNQRKVLQQKAGHMPHVLAMTATPIPRSLALTLYGELDISIIKHKPPGRLPVVTKLCSPNSRKQLNEKLLQLLATKTQVYVVCPLIEPGLEEQGRSARAVYDELRLGTFKKFRIGLLHGQMKAAEKDAIMKAFVDHQLDILVSTTVIEVGVDVPNANVMVIENADRFGLAQIHQLRGRVGRSSTQGYCFLMVSTSQSPSPRLRALESTTDGFALAELDLDLRGPGAIYGTQQHGQLDLRIAKLSDVELIARARKAAAQFITSGEDLLQYPQLAESVTRLRAVTNLN